MSIPKSHQVFYLSSSLEAMERILQNAVNQYSFHFVNGAFSQKWHQFALALHKNPRKVEVKFGNGFIFQNLTIPQKAELICLTQNETSTGVCLPLGDIYRLRSSYPDSLISLDIVSSAPYPAIDFTKIDMTFFSVQKGFGLPAGLGVLIVNDRALQKSHQLSESLSIGTYHSFLSLMQMSQKNQTPETPNVLNIYLLGKVCQDMLKKGITEIRKETEIKAKLLYDFAETSSYLKPFIKEKKFRSPTIIVLTLLKRKTSEVVLFLKKKDLIVGRGYGEFKDSQIRIANFPAHSVEDMKKLIKTMSQI